MRILAIDPATMTGWATKDAYGTWNLKMAKDESEGMKWLRFKAKLREVYDLADIQLVVYERPAGRHTGAVIHHAKMVAIIQEFCAEYGLEYKGYSPTEIKKHATNIGNCGKSEMLFAAQDRLAYEGDDDNEVDALWLYDMAFKEFGAL